VEDPALCGDEDEDEDLANMVYSHLRKQENGNGKKQKQPGKLVTVT